MTLSGPDGTQIRTRSTARVLLFTGAAFIALGVALLGARLAARDTGELPIPAAGITSALRMLVFAGLAVMIGDLAGARLAGRGPRPRSWALPAALVCAAASAGQIVLLSAVSGLDPPTVHGLREGRLLLFTAGGFAVAAGCLALGRPRWAAVPLVVVIAAEALRAHPETYWPVIGTALTVVHLTAASLWTGTLLNVLRTMALRRGGRDVLVRYARMAAWLFAAVVGTGIWSTLRKLPLEVAFTTAYGRVLIAKLMLVGAAGGLALAARRRMLRGGDPAPPAGIELTALVGIVLLSAVLTVVPDPRWIGAG